MADKGREVHALSIGTGNGRFTISGMTSTYRPSSRQRVGGLALEWNNGQKEFTRGAILLYL